jgi:hypothetical protein
MACRRYSASAYVLCSIKFSSIYTADVGRGWLWIIVGENGVRRCLRREWAGVFAFAARVSSGGAAGAESLKTVIFSLTLLVCDTRELLREVRDEGTDGARFRDGMENEKATAGRSGCDGSSLGPVWCF